MMMSAWSDAKRLWYRDAMCSGQIGFMICSKAGRDGEKLDSRVARQPPPQRADYPALR